MLGMSDRPIYGSSLPPGCRQADLDRGVSRQGDCTPAELWRLLDERRRLQLLRKFLADEWAELAGLLEEPPPNPGAALRSLWLSWRDAAVSRLALEGRIGDRQ